MLPKSAGLFVVALFVAFPANSRAWFNAGDWFNAHDRFGDLDALASEVITETVPTAKENEDALNKEREVVDILTSYLKQGLGFPSGLSVFRREPWWKGPDTCVTKVEQITNNTELDDSEGTSPFIILGNAAFSTCRNTLNKYICTNKVYTRDQTKTTEVTYQCCPGARRNHDTDYCERVDVKSLQDTSEKLGSSEFARAMNLYVKKSVIDTPNMTIFVPSDAAIKAYLQTQPTKYTNELVVHAAFENETKVETSSVTNTLDNEIPKAGKEKKTVKKSILSGNAMSSERALNHFVPGVYDVHDLENEEILDTIDGLPIRINIYHGERKPIITANCAVVKSANHPIENDGMLHVTDAILPQVTKSIRDILLENSNFNMFTDFASTSDLLEELGEPGNYTVFVASDGAFEKLSEELRTQLKKGKSCIQTLIKAHVIPRTLCSGAFGKLKVMTRSMSGNWLTIEKSDNGSLQIGKDSRTTITDIVASNGVIHVIDYPIIPKSAQPVSTLLEKKNHTLWLSLMRRAGFSDEADASSNRTIFVPSEQALRDAKLDTLDDESLKRVVSLHISDESVCSCQMKNNLMLPSLVPEKELRITTYETSSTLFIGLDPKIMVQCASIIEKDGKACDTMVHEVDKVLTAATESTFDKINNDPEFDTLKNILTGTNLYEELKNGSLGPVTLLAPTKKAFANLSADEWKTLDDKTVADELLRRHIVTDVVCCGGVGMSSWPFAEEVTTANGFSIGVRRKNREQVLFGETTTESCDHLTKDGLIHFVDKVMMPRPISLKGSAVKYMDPSGSEIVLFGLKK